MMHLPIAGIVSGSSGAVVTVSGESISTTESGGAAEAWVGVKNDGTMTKRNISTFTQIDATTDWIIPNGDADSTYDARVTSVTGDAFTTKPGTNGDWFNLGTTRYWGLQRASVGTSTITFTLEIRKDGGAILDSASYTLTSTWS